MDTMNNGSIVIYDCHNPNLAAETKAIQTFSFTKDVVVAALEFIKDYSSMLAPTLRALEKYDYHAKVKKVQERKRLKNKRTNRT